MPQGAPVGKDVKEAQELPVNPLNMQFVWTCAQFQICTVVHSTSTIAVVLRNQHDSGFRTMAMVGLEYNGTNSDGQDATQNIEMASLDSQALRGSIVAAMVLARAVGAQLYRLACMLAHKTASDNLKNSPRERFVAAMSVRHRAGQ